MLKLIHFHSLKLRFAVSLGVLIAVLFSTLALPAAPAFAADCQLWHTVQRGETLYLIGRKYNFTWDRIAAANGLTNPNKIYAGQVLCIPRAGTGTGGGQPPPDVVIVLPTDVQFVQALTDVNMRVGPGLEFAIMGKVFAGQTAKVTGVSGNGLWWRVICPDNTTGNCWITAGSQYTRPVGGTPPVPQPPLYSGIPTIAITGVVRDQTVTIRTNNYPAGRKFDVLMGTYGTAGVNGHYVTTIDSGNGGALSFTFNIPAALRGATRVAIRLQNYTGGYYSYNWFWNNTAN